MSVIPRLLTFVVECEFVEGFAAGLLADVLVDDFRCKVVEHEGVRQRLHHGLQAERHVGVAQKRPGWWQGIMCYLIVYIR